MVCASAQAKSAPAIPGGVVASASEKGRVLGSRQTGDVRGGPTLSERILTGLSSGDYLPQPIICSRDRCGHVFPASSVVRVLGSCT
jgi:hypothetical protein